MWQYGELLLQRCSHIFLGIVRAAEQFLNGKDDYRPFDVVVTFLIARQPSSHVSLVALTESVETTYSGRPNDNLYSSEEISLKG